MIMWVGSKSNFRLSLDFSQYWTPSRPNLMRLLIVLEIRLKDGSTKKILSNSDTRTSKVEDTNINKVNSQYEHQHGNRLVI